MNGVKKFGLALAVAGLSLAGLDAAGFLKFSAEDRINAAIPFSDDLRNAIAALEEGVPAARRKKLEARLGVRLKLRALTCANGYTPPWLGGAEEIRKHLDDRSCFIAADHDIARWLGLVRAGVMLAAPPVRPVPAPAPAFIVASARIQNARFADRAGVALIETPGTIEVIDYEGGRPLFTEPRASNTVGPLSSNGRLFVMSEGDSLVIRDSESGSTVAELPAARVPQFYWLDERTALYSKSYSGKSFLIDFDSGREIPVEGLAGGLLRAVRVPGAANQYALLSYQTITKIELVRDKVEPEVKLIGEKPFSDMTWSVNTVDVVADGGKLFSAGRGLAVVTLQSLEIDTRQVEPFNIVGACPTPDPDKIILNGYVPTSSSRGAGNYVYSISQNSLMPIRSQEGAGVRYAYIPALKRQAEIRDNKIAVVDALDTRDAVPLAQFVSDALQRLNEDKLEAFDRQQRLLQQNAAQYPAGGFPVYQPQMLPAPAFSRSEIRAMGVPAIAALARAARIESIGVYQGAGESTRSVTGRAAKTVEVLVRHTASPIVLVLSAYEPVQWRLRLAAGARLNAVLVSGYYPSQVTGAGSARVLTIGSAYAYKPGSVEYAALNREVLQSTGRTIDAFQGSYEGRRFTIGG